MERWQNFYLQRMGTDANGSTYPVCESVSTWGVWCKDIPFIIAGDVKDVSKRTWNDEYGDEEYIGEEGLYLEAYTMKIELGCKKLLAGNAAGAPAVDDVRHNVGNFLKYLRESGMMKLYSSYTRIGRRNVRLESVSDDAKWKSEDGEEWLIFGMTFKVNDPVTDIILSV